MRLYAPTEVLAFPCPACRAPVGVWCSPWKACERRIQLLGIKEVTP